MLAIPSVTALPAVLASASLSPLAGQLQERLARPSSVLLTGTLTVYELRLLRSYLDDLGIDAAILRENLTWNGITPALRDYLRGDDFMTLATEPVHAGALQEFIDFLDILDDPGRWAALADEAIRSAMESVLRIQVEDLGASRGTLASALWQLFMGRDPIFVEGAAAPTRSAGRLETLFGQVSAATGQPMNEIGLGFLFGQARERHGTWASAGRFAGLECVGFVNEPLARPASPDEVQFFNEFLTLIPKDGAALGHLASSHADGLDLSSLRDKERRLVRHLSWLCYRLADEQMAQTNMNLALKLLAEAIRLLKAHQGGTGARKSVPVSARILTAWEARQGQWLDWHLRLEVSAWGALHLSHEARQDRAWAMEASAAHFGGVQALAVAEELLTAGYAVYCHQLLHYDAEPALGHAEHLFARHLGQPELARRAAGAHAKARALHARAHRQMFESREWMPYTSEDGRTLMFPNIIFIRTLLSSLAQFFHSGPIADEDVWCFNNEADMDLTLAAQRDIERTVAAVQPLRKERPSPAEVDEAVRTWARMMATLRSLNANVLPPSLRALDASFVASMRKHSWLV